jgi:abhydrolase domain-containing protein 14
MLTFTRRTLLALSLMIASVGACAKAEPGALVEFDIKVLDTDIHGLEAGPADGKVVLLLHGNAFTSATWQELGTVELLADAGFRTIAIDLPEKGESGKWPHVLEGFLIEFLGAMKIESCAVIAPSMSGAYAFPLVTIHQHRVSAFVPIAPIRIKQFLTALPECNTPTLALWGENDSLIPIKLGNDLADAMPNARLHVIPNAEHACYMQATELFHQELLAFLESCL